MPRWGCGEWPGAVDEVAAGGTRCRSQNWEVVVSMRKDRHGLLVVLTPTFAGRWHLKPPSHALRTPDPAGSTAGPD